MNLDISSLSRQTTRRTQYTALISPPGQEGVSDCEVALDGDGDGAVDAAHQPDVGQGEHVGQDEDPVTAAVLLVELGHGEQQDGADDVDLKGRDLLCGPRARNG